MEAVVNEGKEASDTDGRTRTESYMQSMRRVSIWLNEHGGEEEEEADPAARVTQPADPPLAPLGDDEEGDDEVRRKQSIPSNTVYGNRKVSW